MRSKFLTCKPFSILAAAIAFYAITAPSPVYAEIYKCVSADGETTYDDSPCKAHQSTHLFNKSAREVAGLDCRIARNLAFDAVARMRQDDSATDVFNTYGGADAIGEDVRNLINHVYAFQADTLISAQTIVDLTIDRCQAGLLGETLDQCDAFPQSFIAQFGDCVEARQNDLHGQTMRAPGSKDPIQANYGKKDTATPTLKAAKPLPGADLEQSNPDINSLVDDQQDDEAIDY